MRERTQNDFQFENFSRRGKIRPVAGNLRPFWLPAVKYYLLTAIVAIVVFLFIWAALHEGNEEEPLVFALICAGLVFGSAAIFREFFLRKARNRYLAVERRLDQNLRILPVKKKPDEPKISLKQNAEIIKWIQKKSEAAKILKKLTDAHLEVCEMCSEYLTVSEKQLEIVGIGSPRLAGLRRGRQIVQEIHHFHLLHWAQVESRHLTQKAQKYVTISKKINAAEKALSVLDSALQFYPNETQLIESEAALKNFIASTKISHWIEQAERAEFKGNSKRALSLYRDALFFLAREDGDDLEKEKIAEIINTKIEKVREISEKKSIKKLNK